LDILSGRGSKAKAAANIFVMWVVVNAFFQFLSDGLKWREDRQMRAWLLGPLNNLLIAGTFIRWFTGRVTGETFGLAVSPAVQIFDEIDKMITKGTQIAGDIGDPYSDVSLEDVIAMLEYMAKGVGMATGVPTPYLVQVEKAIREGKPINILYSDWALSDDNQSDSEKAEDEIAKLGTDKEQTEQEEELGRIPDVYGMNDLETKLASIYKSVLPTKIKSDEPLVKSWAEKETAWNEYAILPNVPLKDLIKYDSDGENIVEWYKQYQERQTITNLPDLITFDKLFPNATKGNISKREYELLIGYLDSTNKTTYLKQHPELNIDPQDQYLKDNAKQNALLALWGDAKLYTKEAYDALMVMVEELDIPNNALPKGIPPAQIADDYFKYYSANSDAEKDNIRRRNPVLDAWGNFTGIWSVTQTGTNQAKANAILKEMRDGTFEWEK